ncbi:MAG TPA: DUF1906 domain-containing protein [Stackebrandtia sp.]|jgi:hypothetical protein|uniref:DUF1906 domain-containing protein n=1 Tax=Stackebrandtia sp. TaxID=2023065 RepID=UPI002D591481|nr:DUF1906 domain-containing protein [Stackebrandtia sp.]HZE38265.1 DUF1906 domain-containing protein [Stackebrandtia sp.]
MSRQRDRHRRAWLVTAVSAGALLAAGAVSLPVLADQLDTKQVAYHGYAIDVPDSWRVVNLDEHPNACVRFDSATVYLGTPGERSTCPARVEGRAAAIMVAPLDTTTAAGADSATVATTAARGAKGATSVDGTTRLAVEDAGVMVSAVHSRSTAAQVRAALNSARLTDGAHAVRLDDVRSATPRAKADPIVAPGTLKDKAFDTCTAQSQSTMDAWRSSPYKAVGIYISGVNRACGQDNLNADWVAKQHANGWQFVLTHHGLESPCSTRYSDVFSKDPATARQQGKDEAGKAIDAATKLGFGAGSAIYADIESYDGDATCTKAVLSFVSGWAEGLKASGWLSGMYSSGSTGIRDLCDGYGDAAYAMPSHMWFAWWNSKADTDSGSYCEGDKFADGQRIHQYAGDVTESYGGVSVNIDRDFLDVKAG